MAKIFKSHLDALKAFSSGIKKLANAVSTTLGPKGRNVLFRKNFGAPQSTKDGVSVVKEIFLKDPFENMGVRLVKEASTKTADIAGDGTTTAIVLAEALFSEGLKGVGAGLDPSGIKKGIDKAVKFVEEELIKMATPISSEEEVLQIATISANNDKEVGAIVAEAMKKVGKDGIISTDEAKGVETILDVVEGMQFDQGFVSPYFVTNPENMEVVMENPYIFIIDNKLSSQVKEIVSFLEKIVKDTALPLLIIAEDVDGEVLTTLVVNKLKAGLPVCAVKAPGFGDRRKAILEDIACVTGATVISSEIGQSLENAELSCLGRASRVKISKDSTVIVGGCGSSEKIKQRELVIRADIASCSSDYELEKLEERLAKLVAGVAVIRVGANSEIELKEKKDRVEDAVHATRAAVLEGVVVGGGVALLRAVANLEKKVIATTEEEKFGIQTVFKAAFSPLTILANNCGCKGEIISQKVFDNSENKNFGYNGLTDTFEDLVEKGVLDPVLVTRTALKNAASVAGLLLTSVMLIAKKPESKQHSSKQGMGGGMPGMGGGMPGMGGGMPGMGGGMPGMGGGMPGMGMM